MTKKICCCGFDVGVRTLSYSIIYCEKDEITNEIFEWDLKCIAEVDLHENKTQKIVCDGKKKNNENCTNNAIYTFSYPDDDKIITKNYCKIHQKITKDLWDDEDTKNLFLVPKNKKYFSASCAKCAKCDTKEKIKWKIYDYEKGQSIYFCTNHKNSYLSKLKNIYKLKQIKKIKKKITTKESILCLLDFLDSLNETIKKFKVTHIAIENQKFVGLVMRSIASFIYSYFIIKKKELDLTDIFYVSAESKLKLDGKTTPKSIKNIKDVEKKYKPSKTKSICYVKYLLGFELSKKDKLNDKYLLDELKNVDIDCNLFDKKDKEDLDEEDKDEQDEQDDLEEDSEKDSEKDDSIDDSDEQDDLKEDYQENSNIKKQKTNIDNKKYIITTIDELTDDKADSYLIARYSVLYKL